MAPEHHDSPLAVSVSVSIIGAIGFLISISTIVQALWSYFTACRNAPAEFKRYHSSISNTRDENASIAEYQHVPGRFGSALGSPRDRKGRWTEMLQESLDAQIQLEEELAHIQKRIRRTAPAVNWSRLVWIFERKDLEESVKRVETLRTRRMAIYLNALMDDMTSVKEALERIETKLAEGPVSRRFSKFSETETISQGQK